MDRKEFLKNFGYACLCAPVLVTALQSCGTTGYVAKSSVAKGQIVVDKSEFVVVKKDKKNYRKYVLVKSDKLLFPVCVFRLNDDEYTALLMRCTHRSCELKPEGNYLVCPCHGSEFTNRGVVQNPPAEQNLETYKITIDNEHIYVHI